MSNSQKKDEKEIFTAAVELKTPAEREAYLDNACGADLDLRARITALLDAREKPSQVLDQLIGVLSNDAFFEAWMKQEKDSLDFLPSTYQSLLRGSSSEEKFLTGEILHLGEKNGLATPVNSLLMRKLENMIQSGHIKPIPPETLWNSIDEVKSSV